MLKSEVRYFLFQQIRIKLPGESWEGGGRMEIIKMFTIYVRALTYMN